MNSYDLIIRNGSVVTESGIGVADVAVSDGVIVALEPEIDGDAKEAIDATGQHLFPGVIDAHVHFNEPGRTDWEGWASGSRALAAGGGTCAFDMPLNAHPPTVDGAAFDAKRAAAESQSVTDFALWGGLVPGNLDRLDELAAKGAIGVKAFMSNSGIDDFPAVDDLTLYEGMVRAAKLGLIVAVHAESEAITSALAAHALREGRTSARDYVESRPVVAELEAIARAIFFAEETGCALHIVHVSTGRGAALVATAKARGVDVSCETCPHYLALTEDYLERLGAVAKCAPPLRSADVQGELWQGLLAGNVPMIASDHSPSPPSMKGGSDFFAMWGGISGCQSLLSVILTEGFHRRRVPLEMIASLTAGFAARRFRLPGKGAIAIGRDADLALVKLDQTFELSRDDLRYRHRQSPFVGMTWQGKVLRTVLRGRTIFPEAVRETWSKGRMVHPEIEPKQAVGNSSEICVNRDFDALTPG
jgi:allantoinase